MRIGTLQDYKNFAKIFWPIFILGAVLLFSVVNTFFKSRIENQTKYNFKITKLEKDDVKNHLFVYSGEEEMYLWNFSLQADKGIEVGDVVYKDKCSEYLYILRKDLDGKYYKFRKENYTGMFPIQIFCGFH